MSTAYPRTVSRADNGIVHQPAHNDPATSKGPTQKSLPGSVPAMWSSVVGLALLAGLNLVRLGLTLLVIARPRPVRNLLAFCAGCLTGAIPVVVVPLALLNVTPMFASFTQGSASPATDSTVRHIQLGMGALALSIAALMTVRLLTRRRQQASLPIPRGTTSTQVLDSKPTAISRLLSRAQDAPTEGGSPIRRLLRRAHNAWENGSLWV